MALKATLKAFGRDISWPFRARKRTERMRNALELEISRLRTMTDVSQGAIDHIQSQLDGVKSELNGAKSELDGAKSELSKLREEIREEIDDLQGGRLSGEQRLREDITALARQMEFSAPHLVASQLNEPSMPSDQESSAFIAQATLTPTYAQAGEDRILYYIFRSIRSDFKLTYADLGAASPAGDSNTYLFYTLGGSGLIVEADPTYLPAYRAVRPRDAVMQVAIVPSSMRSKGSVTLHAMENRGWSTISTDHLILAGQLEKGAVRDTFTVPCRTINEVLGEHFGDRLIDIVSIDLEGIDHQVIDDLDLNRFQPKVIVLETSTNASNERHPQGDRLLLSGYELYASTWINSIYVRSEIVRSIRY